MGRPGGPSGKPAGPSARPRLGASTLERVQGRRKGRWRGPGSRGDPSPTQPGQGQAAALVCGGTAHLLGLLLPQMPHLLAEHAGAGLVLPERGLPVLVVVHGLLCWKELLRTGGSSASAVTSSWATLCPEDSCPRIRTGRGSVSPANQADPSALVEGFSGAGEGTTMGAGAWEAPGVGTCTQRGIWTPS